MKIVSAHQPAYLPWLGYFHKIALSDDFVILDEIQLEKNGHVNRNQIKGPNGSYWLSVPLLMKGHTRKTIGEMAINNQQTWRKKHLKSIENDYRKAPYFEQYIDFYRDILTQEWHSIVDLTDEMLSWYLMQLDIKTRIHKQSSMNLHGRKSDLILDMIEQLKGDVYISGAQGRNYLRLEEFANKKIHVYFQDYQHPTYPQFQGEFRPFLSIVDILFNCGPQAKEYIFAGNIHKNQLID